METFNRVYEETGDEEQARQAAWRNIKREYRKVGDEWVKKESTVKANLKFLGSVHTVSADKQKLATFYIMNTSKNLAGWGVTDEALTNALPTLIGKPLGIPADLIPGDHDEDMIVAGKFVEIDKPNGYALATAEITDPRVWKQLQAGTIGPISVVVSAYEVHCSLCGENLGGDRAAEHECLKEGSAYEVLTNFVFNQVDLVDQPAWPQAGLLTVEASMGGVVVPLVKCASLYNSQSINGRATRSLSGTLESSTNRNGEKEMTDEEKTTIEKLAEKVIAVEKAIADIQNKLKAEEVEKDEHGCVVGKERWDAEEGKCVPLESPEVAALKEKVASLQKERHDAVLETAVEARYNAGLALDKAAEQKRLQPFNDEYLKLLAKDAEKLAEKRANEPELPQTQYGASGAEDLQAAENQIKQRLGFKVKEENE